MTMNNNMKITEELELISDYLVALRKIRQKMLIMEANLERETFNLCKKPFGKHLNVKKIHALQDIKTCYAYQNYLISALKDSFKENLKTIQSIFDLGKTVSFLITKESYRQYQLSMEACKDLIFQMRLFSIPVFDFFNSKLEMVRFRESELCARLESMENFIRNISLSFSFQKLEVNFEESLDYTCARNVLDEFDSLGDILLFCIQSGYDYESYYQLSYTYVQITYFNNQAKQYMKETLKSEEDNLKQNANDVIEHNLCHSEVLNLYSEEQLFAYRDFVLESMKSSSWNPSKANHDLLKLKRIHSVLADRVSL